MWKTFARMAGVILLIQCSCVQPKKGETYGQKSRKPGVEPSVTMEWEGNSDDAVIELHVAHSFRPSDCNVTIYVKKGPNGNGKWVAQELTRLIKANTDCKFKVSNEVDQQVRFDYKTGETLDLSIQEKDCHEGKDCREVPVPEHGQKLMLKCKLLVSISERM